MVDVTVRWRDERMLPRHHASGWSLCLKGRVTEATWDEVRTRIRRWMPVEPLLIASPDSDVLLPPPYHPELYPECRRAVLRQTMAIAVMATIFGLLCVATVGWLSPGAISGTGITLLMLAMLFGHERLVLAKSDALKERALFFYWLKVQSSAGVGFYVWLFVVIVMGLMQLGAIHYLGSATNTIYAVGMYYPAIDDGAWWRVVTGPYFHSSLLHYGTNAAFLVLFGALAWAYFSPWFVIALFVSATSLSMWMQYQFGPHDLPAAFGVSGGVAALMGSIVTLALIQKNLFPKGVGIGVVGVTVLCLITPELYDNDVATVAHISGVVMGLMAGFLILTSRLFRAAALQQA